MARKKETERKKRPAKRRKSKERTRRNEKGTMTRERTNKRKVKKQKRPNFVFDEIRYATEFVYKVIE